MDNNGNEIPIDYEVSEYKNENDYYELSNEILSYRIEGNNLYVKVNRYSSHNSFWFCTDKKEDIAEYELKFEYLDGAFVNREIVKEIKGKDKYKAVSCDIDVKNAYTKEQIKYFVNDFPYSKILDNEYDYSEMWASYLINSIFSKNENLTVVGDIDDFMGWNDSYLNSINTRDKNDIKYPKYKYGSTEHIYMALGLTVNDISKKEFDINNYCSPCGTSVMNGEEIRKEIEKL